MGEYKFFSSGLNCGCCGKMRKHMYRKTTRSFWVCSRCWRHCPSIGKCLFRKNKKAWVQCDSMKELWHCTREKGHKGRHICKNFTTGQVFHKAWK